MGLYIFILFIYIVLIIFESYSKVHNNTILLKIWNFLLGLPIWIIVAFRGAEVGADTRVYERLYNLYNVYEANYVYSHFTMEKGYIALCRLCGRCGMSYQAFQVLIATVTIASFGLFIYNHSENCAYSWIIFITLLFMARSMNIMREMFTVSFSIFGIFFLKDKKYLHYVALVFFLSFFHMSAVVLLIVLIFELIQSEYLRKTLTIMGCICLPVFFELLAIGVTNLIGRYSHLLNSIYMNVEGGIAKIFYIIIVLFMNGWYAKNKKRSTAYSKLTGFERIWENYLYIAAIFCFGGLKFGLMDRISVYYTVSYLVLIPNLLNRETITRRKIISYNIIMVLFLYFIMVLVYRNEWHRITPYSFF